VGLGGGLGGGGLCVVGGGGGGGGWGGWGCWGGVVSYETRKHQEGGFFQRTE